MSGRPLSQSQRYVLKIYREMLRESRRFDGSVRQQIIDGFHQNRAIPRANTLHIEFHIRQAEKKLDLMKKPTTKGYGSSQ